MKDDASKTEPAIKRQFTWKQDDAGKWHKKPIKVRVQKRLQNTAAEPPVAEPPAKAASAADEAAAKK